MIKYTLLLLVLLVEIIRVIFWTTLMFLWDFRISREPFDDAVKEVKQIITWE